MVWEEIFELVFTHRQFTGRSGGMYAYEGLGSIYWHMVSKLLLAALENFQKAVADGSDPVLIGRLADCYFDIRAGIGFNKTPDNYGAFPTDPYSHTPGFAGAKQPGMTGQVKEEVIARLLEVGVSVVKGSITFNPFILRKSEFLSQADSLGYFDVNGDQQIVALAAGQLGINIAPLLAGARAPDDAEHHRGPNPRARAPAARLRPAGRHRHVRAAQQLGREVGGQPR